MDQVYIGWTRNWTPVSVVSGDSSSLGHAVSVKRPTCRVSYIKQVAVAMPSDSLTRTFVVHKVTSTFPSNIRGSQDLSPAEGDPSSDPK